MTLLLSLLLLVQSPDDLAKGKKLYQGQCALCHGQTAQGGRGPNLARPTLTRAPDDAAFFSLLRSGIPGSEMDSIWQLNDNEVKLIIAYVRSLGSTPQEKLPGDSARGLAVYVKSNCAGCHIVAGAGTAYGPELTAVGAKRSAANLREHLLSPGKSAADDFLMVRVTTRDGRKITGIRVNEDSFKIVLQDASGAFHSYRKRDLAEFKKLPGESPMPSFASLSPSDLDDLIAYLASLRGKS